MTEKIPSHSILIVEDERKLASVLADYLTAAGYAPTIFADGAVALDHVRAHAPDLILLDLTLPGMDGLDVCRAVRTFSDVPIFMITARVEEIDRLLGLDVGADDYLCKPFSPREVVARVRAILRRSRAQRNGAEIPGLVIDEQGLRVQYHGSWLDLTRVEFRLLTALARSPGRVFSRDQLLDCLYSDHRLVTDRTVDSHVKNLRRKLHAAYPEHELVRSVYGVGYKIEP